MSAHLTAAAWGVRCLSAPAKLVLLLLCHLADEAGQCHPTVNDLVEETGVSERTIQLSLIALEQRQLLTRVWRGRGGTTYAVVLPGAENPAAPAGNNSENPAAAAPFPPKNPAAAAPFPDANPAKTPQDLHHFASTYPDSSLLPFSKNLSPLAVQKERKGVQGETKTRAAHLAFPLPDWMPAQAWADFVESRNKLRKPLTAGAVRIIVAKLARWRAGGHDPEDVLNNSTENGWQGVFEPRASSYRGSTASRSEQVIGLAMAEYDREQAASRTIDHEPEEATA